MLGTYGKEFEEVYARVQQELNSTSLRNLTKEVAQLPTYDSFNFVEKNQRKFKIRLE